MRRAGVIAIPALALLAACGADDAPAPGSPADPPAAVDLGQPEQVFRTVCLDQMPAFRGAEAALDAAGIAHARNADGTLVGQGAGIGVLVVPTQTPGGDPAMGCMVESGGTLARHAENLRAIIATRVADGAEPPVTETPFSEAGLEGLRWSWREKGRDVIAELFQDPSNNTAKMLLTVPGASG